MATLADVVAAVVVHSSAAAYSHFGVTLEKLPEASPTPAERVVARSQRKVEKVVDCPQTRAKVIKA